MTKRKRLNATKSGISDDLTKRINEYKNGDQQSVAEMSSKEFIESFRANTKRGRMIKDAYNHMVSDMGGIENISFAQSELARRAAALSVLGFEAEASLALQDPEFDLEEYIVLSRAQTQLFKAIGMDRKKKKVEPDKEKEVSLDSYIENSDK